MHAVATRMDMAVASAQAFFARNQKLVLMVAVMALVALVSATANAATPGDAWASAAFTFINDMATGNVVRGICIVGGLLGMMAAAANGKPILALSGVVLAIFGFLSPTMINAVFGTALI